MGVEYSRYLIPKPNSFRPSPRDAAGLVEALRIGQWLAQPESTQFREMTFRSSKPYPHAAASGYFVRTLDGVHPGGEDLVAAFERLEGRDALLVWPVENLGPSGLRYPLEPEPYDTQEDKDECYFEFQIHLGNDFIYHTSEVVDPFEPEPRCKCGTPLEYHPEGRDPFYAGRLKRTCGKCGELFDVTDRPCIGRDGETGATLAIPGGASYRFAVVVDCGKMFHDGSAFWPELRALVAEHFGIQLYEVSNFY